MGTTNASSRSNVRPSPLLHWIEVGKLQASIPCDPVADTPSYQHFIKGFAYDRKGGAEGGSGSDLLINDAFWQCLETYAIIGKYRTHTPIRWSSNPPTPLGSSGCELENYENAYLYLPICSKMFKTFKHSYQDIPSRKIKRNQTKSNKTIKFERSARKSPKILISTEILKIQRNPMKSNEI